jgi:hypothetical protein
MTGPSEMHETAESNKAMGRMATRDLIVHETFDDSNQFLETNGRADSLAGTIHSGLQMGQGGQTHSFMMVRYAQKA